MLERGGKVVCRVVKNTSKKSLTVPILKTIKRTATLFTDEWGGYDTVGKIYTRYIVDHSSGQYVDGDATTNRIVENDKYKATQNKKEAIINACIYR